MHLTKEPPLERVCVLEDLDFYWDKKELKQIRKMWDNEIGIKYIAEYFKRDPDEVILAILHLAREDKIIPRKRGLLG